MAERLYFAYGSNINLEQMAVRCPAAQVVGPAVLDGYELLFRGNRRGTGVATIEPLPGSQVHGLLWKLTPECERSLDVYEGYPRLYEKENITVRTGDGKDVVGMAYIMTGELWRDPTIPSPAYYGGRPGTLSACRKWTCFSAKSQAGRRATMSDKGKRGAVWQEKPSL